MTTVRTRQPEVTSPETETAPAEFRRRLLEGMAAAIRECGFRDSTVADVVRHARTSRRTFYEHFPSKQACFMALLQEANAAMVRQIAAAVDPGTRWDVQVRQAIEAWIAGAQSDRALTLSWIRDLPSLGSDARHLQREALEAFVVLIQNLSDTPELRAAGVAPPSRQLAILLLGGLRELIATTVEDGGDIAGITEVAVLATQALLGPRRLGPTIQRQGVAMDELGRLRARRERQARAVVRLEREVTTITVIAGHRNRQVTAPSSPKSAWITSPAWTNTGRVNDPARITCPAGRNSSCGASRLASHATPLAGWPSTPAATPVSSIASLT